MLACLPIPVQCWAIVAVLSWRCRRSQSDRHPVYAAHCWFNADKSSTTLAQHYSNTWSVVYLAATPQQKRAIHPMLVQRPRRWPDIETTFGDCPMFAGTAHYYAGDAFTCRRQKSHYPDNTIHWPNADVMLATVCDDGSTLFQP